MSENVNITPEMINNLVDILKTQKTNDTNNTNNSDTNNSTSPEDSRGIFSNFTSDSNSNNNFDINTIVKIKSIMDTLNKKNDPKSNLLYSLKPYLRKSRQAKLDQYVNILKISQVASLFSKNEEESK